MTAERSRMWIALPILLMGFVLAACSQASEPAAPTRAAQPTATAPTAKASPTVAKIPQACALLTVADVEKISGYTGGAATSLDIGEGASQCTIITGKGALSVQVTASPGAFPLLPGEKPVNLEGGAIGKVSTQSLLDQDWMTKINIANYNVLMVLGGSATTLNPDKKIANVTKADGSKMTFGQAYEAFARAIAHNAATGAPAPGGVVQLGDPCSALTLNDVKQLVPDFDVTGPDYQDTTFGVKQCIYRFRSSTPQAAGFATLAFITQPKFEADMPQRDPVSGIGDAAGITGGMFLDFKKGNTFVYMTFTVGGNDPKFERLQRDGLKQLALKVVARLK